MVFKNWNWIRISALIFWLNFLKHSYNLYCIPVCSPRPGVYFVRALPPLRRQGQAGPQVGHPHTQESQDQISRGAGIYIF